MAGAEANQIGDSPQHFRDDAQVLVADLGYTVTTGGSARIRSYQSLPIPRAITWTQKGGFD